MQVCICARGMLECDILCLISAHMQLHINLASETCIPSDYISIHTVFTRNDAMASINFTAAGGR